MSRGAHNYNRAFAVGIALNVAFVIIEAVYGALADSLALIADAGHNLSDVASLLLAWGPRSWPPGRQRKNGPTGLGRQRLWRPWPVPYF